MKLIIDISDDIYNRLQTDFVSAGNTFYDTALNSIINGTPVSTELATNLQPTCNNLQQRQGEWERVGLFYDRNVIECPFCGDTFCRKDIPNFCENCGAALKG
ncbi:MAG: hypothetical protein J5725_10535, partial [Bacteroidales bacterium]|nr:hypothetical protein [Bacteroidales bacterium]